MALFSGWNPLDADEITAPDMFKILAEIILLNRCEDAATISEIKTVLANWRNKKNE